MYEKTHGPYGGVGGEADSKDPIKDTKESLGRICNEGEVVRRGKNFLRRSRIIIITLSRSVSTTP